MSSVVHLMTGFAGLRLLMAGITRGTGPSPIGLANGALLRKACELLGLRAPAELTSATVALLGNRAPVNTMLNGQLAAGAVTVCMSGYLLSECGLLMLPVAVAGVLGSLQLPVLSLRARLERARRSALHDAPKAIEMLAVRLGSGLSGEEAIRLGSETGVPSWRQIWARAGVEVRLGGPPAVALSRVLTDAGLVEVLPLIRSWRRSIELGLPAAAHLFEAAAGLRAAEHAAALRRAGRTGPVATLVIAMVIAPATVAFLATLLVAGVAGQGLVR